MGLFRHFADDQLIALAKLLELQPVAHDEVIYREGQEGRDLFIVRASTVHVTRKTTIGNQVLTTFGFGSLFGEVSFLDRLERTATAVGVGAGSLYRIPAAALEEAVRRSPEFAVSLLWSFWQTLAEKIRSANAQMSDIFSLPARELGQRAQPDGLARPRARGRRSSTSSAARVCRHRSCASSPPTRPRSTSLRTP